MRQRPRLSRSATWPSHRAARRRARPAPAPCPDPHTAPRQNTAPPSPAARSVWPSPPRWSGTRRACLPGRAPSWLSPSSCAETMHEMHVVRVVAERIDADRLGLGRGRSRPPSRPPRWTAANPCNGRCDSRCGSACGRCARPPASAPPAGRHRARRVPAGPRPPRGGCRDGSPRHGPASWPARPPAASARLPSAPSAPCRRAPNSPRAACPCRPRPRSPPARGRRDICPTARRSRRRRRRRAAAVLPPGPPHSGWPPPRSALAPCRSRRRQAPAPCGAPRRPAHWPRGPSAR